MEVEREAMQRAAATGLQGGVGGDSGRRAKPALSYHFLTRFYDRVVRWTTRERAFRAILREQVANGAAPGARVLDVGCGTGSFPLDLERRRPDLAIVALDADASALAMARRKSELARSAVVWETGRAERLPFAAASFEVVTSSLFFHHLLPAAKVAAACEIWRVLRPGGSLHIADWTEPRGWRGSLGFLLVQLLDGLATTGEHRRGQLGKSVERAGFARVEPTAELDVPLGTIGFWRARKEAMATRTPLGGGP